jgi:monofunctional biosynthetic peptidoglycan transglycosylase
VTRRRRNPSAGTGSGARARPLRRPWSRRIGRGLLLVWLLSLAPVLLWRFVDPPVTLLMLQRWLEAPGGSRLQYQPVPLEAIAGTLQLAVVAGEDQKFPWHRGFDIGAIRAALAAARQGARLRGASTLSQQTAKNVFLWPARSWLRKILEGYYTVLIELLWGKQRILEVYLNVAEMGPLTFGAEAASRAWFGLPATRLSAEQAALLAALLPNPLHRSAAAPDHRVRARQRWILRQMEQLGPRHLAEL